MMRGLGSHANIERRPMFPLVALLLFVVLASSWNVVGELASDAAEKRA